MSTNRNSFEGVRISWRAIAGTIGLVLFIIAGFTAAWKASSAFGQKADVVRLEATDAAVQSLKIRHMKDVYRLELGVYEIRFEQRALIKAVAPEVERDLPILPDPPELKSFPEDAQ